ncbi:hypothetical protein ACIA8O_12650 [Kitasatospora sp. NPDC051853]|uniref:hypothetical protein n=1 Tax=Kitasatospora sp. NPDC051853 TaxID=3364058 RepID=UPI0037A06B7F
MESAYWPGPPRHVLGVPVPVEPFAVRSGHAVVALQHLEAFGEGCGLYLRVAARRGVLSEEVWRGVLGDHGPPGADGAVPGTDLAFGVCLADGSEATASEQAYRSWRPDDRGPMGLMSVGGSSSAGDRFYEAEQQLWLWPLPPPGPFEFTVEWPSLGLERAAVTLDGAAVARAAERARPYWA